MDQYDLLRSVLKAQTRLLDSLIHNMLCLMRSDVLSSDDKEIIKVALPMIQALGITTHSVTRLTSQRDMAIRDCYGMARSASELAVNLCYVIASDVEVARRANSHAMQKSYRNLRRSGELGGFRFEISRKNVPEVSDIPELAKAIDSFTRNGKEIRAWTPVSISDRIAAIGLADTGTALSLVGAVQGIYRYASEFLHGTYFSVIYFWSGNGGFASDRQKFNEVWADHFISVFTALFFSVNATIAICCKKYGISKLDSLQSRMLYKVQEIINSLGADGTTRPLD